jgi:hypothetical protein
MAAVGSIWHRSRSRTSLFDSKEALRCSYGEGVHVKLRIVLGTAAGAVLATWLGEAPAMAQGVGPSSTAPAAPAAALAPTVVVHVDAPRPVTLETLDRNGEWARVCTSPCDQALAADGTFRVRGDGIRDSRSFRLDPVARTTLTIEPTSSGARAGAVVVTVLGAIALVPIAAVTSLIVAGEALGVIFICPLAAAFETVKSQQGAEYGDCLGAIAGFFAPGYAQPIVWVPGIVGGVALTGGIIGLASTPRTAVLVSPAQAVAPTPSVAPTPAAGAAQASLFPRPVIYPLIDLRF